MMRLHHCHETRSMRVLWLLHEIGCDFEVVIHPFDKSLRSEAYLSKHPVGRVPSLEMDGRTIWESGAIIEVLCERFPEAGMGRLPGDPERVDWLIWLHFSETLSQHSASLTQQHVALYEDSMRSPVVMKLEAARVGKCYDAIESRLDGQDYLLDSGFTAADIAVGQAVYMSQHFRGFEKHPRVAAWVDRISARDAFKASLPPEGATRLYDREFYPAWEMPA